MMKTLGRWAFLALMLFLWAALPRPALAAQADQATDMYKTYGAAEARKVVQMPKRWITADHSKHPVLQQEFTSGPEVTKACLTCHNEAAVQFHKTIHWTWKCPADPEQKLGKAGLSLNNFCIGIASNEPRCTSCHAGYGWKDSKTFDFTSQENVDCLVCHDQTGTYKKFPAGAGNPVKEATKFPGNGKMYYPPDWNRVAQSVGRPNRNNCGVCHFFGGGGDGVKHGDLDSSLMNPSRDLDVHMNAEGANFDCVRCHTTEAHKVAGRCYKTPAATDRQSLIDNDLIKRITCESCHTDKPHKPGHKANDHTDIVACQSCHIPTFARVKPTKMYWDWSKAGQMKDGKPYVVEGPYGKDSYATIKGEFRWEKNVTPEYLWFNGTLTNVLYTDTIDPSKPVRINEPQGRRNDPNSRIYPFKVHRGSQPYDSVNNTFVNPHLFGKDENAYWKSFDWGKAITAGMQAMDLPYSGEYGFAKTEYFYQITHMVAPKKNVVACVECHAKDGRLADLAGFYMPGRDHMALLDGFGWLIVVGSIIGVLGHGALRILSRKNGNARS
ncbi:MAG: tetrathionate reductase family octaheme c-type cytochrome [Desulfovibrionaceae bacterium]